MIPNVDISIIEEDLMDIYHIYDDFRIFIETTCLMQYNISNILSDYKIDNPKIYKSTIQYLDNEWMRVVIEHDHVNLIFYFKSSYMFVFKNIAEIIDDDIDTTDIKED